MKKVFLPVALCGMTFSVLAAAGAAADNVTLPVAVVGQAADRQNRTYPGKVVAVARVNIVSRVNGEILELGFKNGDLVKAGQLLYRLDSVKYAAAVKNAEAKVAEYKAKSVYAESNYERNRKLSATRAVSLDTFENALSSRNSYQAALAAAEADLLSAQDDLAHCRILAPISGKISSTNFTYGNYVTTASGTLATLIQTAPIRVRFSISNRDYLTMFNGHSSDICQNGVVTLTLADGRNFPENGRIEYVENASDDGTDSIQVFALFPNADRLLTPGATLGVNLSSRKAAQKPAVPPTAVAQDIRGAYVWKLDDKNIAHRQYVTRGAITRDLQLIEKGLATGDRVVSDGVHKVREKSLVTPAPQEVK